MRIILRVENIGALVRDVRVVGGVRMGTAASGDGGYEA